MKSLLFRFTRWCPGAFGILLRQKLYPRFLGSCGKKILIGRFVNLENPASIHLGDQVVVSDKVTLSAGRSRQQEPSIVLENMVFIGSGSSLRTASGQGKITLKTGSSIGSFCRLETSALVTIDTDVLLAAYCTVGLPLPQGGDGGQEDRDIVGNNCGNIRIESGCWLGVRSSILPGAVIGEGTIVGAHAVASARLPPYVIAVGAPARVLRNRPAS